MTDTAEPGAPAAPEAEGLPASVSDLRAWFSTHCRDNAVSRDTASYNRISDLIHQVEAILLNLNQGA